MLLFIAIVLGIGIWCYFQKDYHPAFQTEENAPEVMSSDEPSSVSETVVTEESKEEPIEEPEMPDDSKPIDNEWGVMLTAENVTSEGMTLICRQSGGSPTGELMTGVWYEIEMLIEGQWKKAPSYAEVCWEDLAWNIPMEGNTQWEVNWTWIYDKLPAGEYRIAKEIMDFRKTGDYDTCISYAYFTIE